jgi:lipopolysaccharide assembly outer membrane protein LptD (OstA)
VPASPAAAQPTVPGPAGRPSIEVTGATHIEYDDASQQWTFRGPRVVVVRGTTRVEAPEILYAERAREVTLPRGGTVATPTLEVTADRLAMQLQTRHVTADGHVSGRFSDEGESQNTWGTLTADRVVVDDRQDLKQIVAVGEVVIVRGDRRLSGDRIAYNHLTQQGTVDGHAELRRGSSRLRADHIFADLKAREARADDHVQLDHDDVRGSADHATYSEPEQTAVLQGNVAIQRRRDTLTADRVTVLLDRHTAVAEGHVQLVAYPEGGRP